MKGIETLGKDIIEPQQGRLMVAGKKILHKMEAMIIIQHIKIPEHIGILHIGAAKSHRLVKNGQSVAHGTIRLNGNDVQGLIVN